MKKLSIFFSMLIASVLYVASANAQIAVSYNNADFEDETNPWLGDKGGEWNGTIFNNENKTIKVLIDGYKEAMGDITIGLHIFKLSSDWSSLSTSMIYSDDEGSVYPAIKASEFTDGQGTFEFDIPAGLKPVEDYDGYAETEKGADAWLMQVKSSTPTDNGLIFAYFGIVIEEEITGSTSIDKLETLDVAVYPNPVNEGGKVFFNASEFSNEVSIEIYNLAGQLVSTQISSASALISVDADFAPGIYNMQINDGDKCATQKFVIK